LVRRCADAEDCIFLEGADLCLNQRTHSPPSFLSPLFLPSSAMIHPPVLCCSVLAFPLDLYESCIICPVMYRAAQLSSTLHNIHYSYYTLFLFPSLHAILFLVFSFIVNRLWLSCVARTGRYRLDVDKASRTHHESEISVIWFRSKMSFGLRDKCTPKPSFIRKDRR